jgi:tol-pal system protein YbgF
MQHEHEKKVCGRPARRWRRAWVRFALVALAIGSVACATPAEMRKLQNRVTDLERGGTNANAGTNRVADVAVEVEGLQRSIDSLNGRVEVMERQVEVALEEARSARREANLPPTPVTPGGEAGGEEAGSPVSGDVQAYRDAYAKWREGDNAACVDLFGKFLQTYPASDHAGDATYWLADCYFKQGNYSAAVLRYDDVARQYPTGNKAADALYRQGEALLRMGHGTAAGNAFEKVLRDYPESARAQEAKRQLELLGAG